ncbi:MAG: hypothetical protein ACXWRE_07175 [Pseudobdellovibrionaceae bacterium]
MTEAVVVAIEQIKAAFPQCSFILKEDGQGGAWVIIENVDISETYRPAQSWIGFRVTFQYPYADIYPHFIRNDLVRADGKPLGDGISSGHNFQERPALQISRRSNRLNPSTDTAALKLLKVISWLKTHP